MLPRRISSRHAALFAGILAVTALLLPAAPAVASPTAAAFSTATTAEPDAIYSLLNDARWANGQAGLLRNASLDQVAAAWAEKLAAAGTLSHNPDYASQIPAGWSNAGENVAQGQRDAGSMHDAWMASPGHRANILGSYSDVGIAFLSAGGTTWGVQVFATYPGHIGPAAPGAVEGSQVAESPAPGEPAQTEVSTAVPTPAPSVTAYADEPEATVTAAANDEGLARWWVALLAAGVGLAGAGFWMLRRRRRTT